MSDEWQVAELDLDAYLDRVGFEGAREPTLEALRALHRAHRSAIPFENLDVVTGRGVDVSLPAVQTKLVGARRGGYCFEHGVLFGAVLERFGFAVDRYLARVGPADGPVRPRTHMSLHVASGHGEWLADVGFGGGLLEPLPWSDGTRARQGLWTYELDRLGERHWQLCEETGTQREALYHFIAEPQHPIDLVVANHYISTHPSSPFVGKPVVMRKTARQQLHLVGRTLTVTGPGDSIQERPLADAEFVCVLRDDFGLSLAEAEIDAVLVALTP